MTKKVNYLKVGQAVINAKVGDANGAVGVIESVGDSSFRVAWKLSPQGIPYMENKTSRFALSALAPKQLEILDPVPETRRGFAFLYPLELHCDIEKMVEAHRLDAERQLTAVQTDFYLIAGVHEDVRFDLSARSCPTQPPVKKYVDEDEAINDAQEMAAKYGNAYVVLGVTAVIKPKAMEEVKQDVVVTRKADLQLENKAGES